jgi:hypothetical protein
MRAIQPVLLFLFVIATHAADFINLTFDEPLLSPPLPSNGPASQLLPGWIFRHEGNVVLTNNVGPAPAIGSAPVRFSLNQNIPVSPIFSGQYVLEYSNNQYRQNSSIPIPITTTLSQRGIVPLDALTLRISELTGPGLTALYINGIAIPEGPKEPGTDNISFRNFDVSGYAGQEVNLEFQLPRGAVGTFDIMGWGVIPKPKEWALLALGGAAVVWVTRRRLRAG